MSAPAPDRPAAPSSRSVPSCHSEVSAWVGSADAPVIALVGSPNVGKSTLYNAVTGLRRDVGNWPGTTVAVGRGVLRLPSGEAALLDLPGAYSLDPLSPDEELTRSLLVDQSAGERPDVVVVTASAAHLSRGLYLLAQLRETDARLVLVVTMSDIAARRCVSVDVAALTAAAGVPVLAIDPRRGEGVHELVDVIDQALFGPRPTARSTYVGDDLLLLADDRFAWISTAVQAATERAAVGRTTWSDRFDRVVTAPFSGALIFLAVMWGVFELTTTVAVPLQGALDALVTGPISSAATWVLDAVGLGTPGSPALSSRA